MTSTYQRPHSLATALDALSRTSLTVVAGGTDFFPARLGRPITDDVLDITGIRELTGITYDEGAWRIGAATSWTAIVNAPLPALFDGLKLAAREVGGVQIQNAGTIAGNLCNASPAADGVPSLLTLDASVELKSRDSCRVVPLEHFVTGNRRTVREADELVTAILVPDPGAGYVSHFLKLGARRYLVISIAMVSGLVSLASDGRINDARLAIGSCSEVARRLPGAEAILIGAAPTPGLETRINADMLASLEPIDDVRAGADYRRHSALVLIRRLVQELLRQLNTTGGSA